MKYFQQQLQLTLNIVFWLFCSEKHIIVGAEEGVYSLNFSEQLHEAEMEQVLCESKLLFKVLNFYGLCKFLSFFFPDFCKTMYMVINFSKCDGIPSRYLLKDKVLCLIIVTVTLLKS